jgi:IS5 family transposase
MLRKAYQNVKKNGDRLAEVDPLIDWEAFKPIIQPIYDNQGSMEGRGRSSYGYKLHGKMDVDHGLVRDLETTPANVHDSRVDLFLRGEVVYRDKGFFGVEPRGYDATMKRGTRSHPLSIRNRLRNKRINRKRAPGERPFAVIKRVFESGHVLVTTVQRVHVKMVFACFYYNLVQLCTLGGG